MGLRSHPLERGQVPAGGGRSGPSVCPGEGAAAACGGFRDKLPAQVRNQRSSRRWMGTTLWESKGCKGSAVAPPVPRENTSLMGKALSGRNGVSAVFWRCFRGVWRCFRPPAALLGADLGPGACWGLSGSPGVSLVLGAAGGGSGRGTETSQNRLRGSGSESA